MLKTKTRNFIMIAMILVVSSALIFVGAYVGKLFAENETVPLAESYMVGETVKIPQKTAGETTSDETIVRFPSGLAQKTDTVTLSEAGKYTVEYRSKGKRMTSESGGYVSDEFVAVRPLYSFDGEKSTAKYGKDESQYDTGKTALNISLAQGETLTFEKTFNVNELDGEFINFYVTPNTKGVYDVHDMWIRLTDVYDENNYLTIKMQAVSFQGQPYVYLASYVLAAHNDEVLSGVNASNPNTIYRNNRFGTAVYLSLYGNGDTDIDGNGSIDGYAVKDSFCAFTYKSDVNQLYSAGPKGERMVVDFDDTAFFANIWGGFTNGDVKMTIYGGGYTGNSFNFNVTSLGGADLSSGKAEDKQAPEIKVDFEGYDESKLPAGVAGEKYKVFDAKAYDAFDGNVNVNARAYYGYNSETRTEIDINNGCVSTSAPGTYVVIYTATDLSGNTSVKEVPFYVDGNPNEINIELSAAESTCRVGENTAFAECNVTGGVGEVKTTVSVDKNHRLLGDSFIPLETGTFTVTFSATDLAGQTAEESYTVEVGPNPSPVVLESVSLPKYVLAGYAYKFPTVTAYDFNTEQSVPTALHIDEKLCENNTLVADKADAGRSLNVKYTAKNSQNADVEVYSAAVEVVNVLDDDGFILIQNYWVTNDFDKEVDDGGITFSAKSGEGDATAEFAKVMLYRNFSLTLKFDKTANAFGSLDIKLTDADNADKTVVIGLKKNEADRNTTLTVNGKETGVTVSGGFFGDVATEIAVTDGIISDGYEVNYSIRDLFDCKKFFVRVTATDISGDAEFEISQYCGQAMNNMVIEDLIGPSVIYPEYAMQYSLNDEITVGAVIAEDALDTFTSATVTVTSPDGTKALSGAADKEYGITLNSYGRWVISYVTTDGNNRNTRRSFVLDVVNFVKPVISVDGSVPKSCKVGQAITLPKASAADDTDGAVAVRCLVAEPGATMHVIGDDYTFTPEKAGIYRIKYVAMDSSGNMTIVEYRINAEA